MSRALATWGGQERQAMLLELFQTSDPGFELAARDRSEASTLANLHKRGHLTRRRVGRLWVYRLPDREPSAQLSLTATDRELVAERTYRIGVQSLWREGDRWFVSIRNRTYRSTVEIPPEKAPIWRSLLEAEGPVAADPSNAEMPASPDKEKDRSACSQP